jgi:vacuolar-type H+-ATPase subunit I/STV1
MQAVNIIGLTKYIDEVITVLGESGVFHPDEVSAFYTELQEFTHVPTNSTYAEHQYWLIVFRRSRN